jgi:hypothetical protein
MAVIPVFVRTLVVFRKELPPGVIFVVIPVVVSQAQRLGIAERSNDLHRACCSPPKVRMSAFGIAAPPVCI